MSLKQYKKLLLPMIFILTISAASNLKIKEKSNQHKEELYQAKMDYPEIYDYMDSLSFESFEANVQNSELLVYIGRTDCGDCTDFEPRFISMLEERSMNQRIMYLNVSKLRQDKNKWETFKDTYNVIYTPTLAHFKEGELISKVEWTPERGTVLSEFADWLDDIIVG
ncbi:thioredoxin family protein [Enterococcus sp. RIT-PI-f]|uniref:thioredoxin family protein n=1 Tax=Enterococcus sp. RIT-PI-f TaxID=1690244 RepID=UPI0006B8E680|nr:thioredoxin family protein [Enterococcus sp. RIT-PI-f]KPG72016.1 hypothetical protein AEQ18_02930 [Enterococcus sp. RIT-PI-f]